MDKLFFFIHIPKAAGMTFRAIMRRNFHPRYKEFSADFLEASVPVESLRASLKLGTMMRAASSHRFTADLPYELDNLNIIGIAFIRNPVERFISSYYYKKKIPVYGEDRKSESLEDFVAWIEKEDESCIHKNYQSRNLSISVEALKEQLSAGKLHLFPLDRYDEALIALKNLYPEDFKDVSYSRRNVNADKPETTSDSLRARIAEVETEDQIRYELANHHLNSVLEQTFEEGVLIEQLRRHKRKCKTRSMFIDPLVFLSEKVHQQLGAFKLG